MTLYQQAVEPVTLDFTNEESWRVEIPDTDLTTGEAIPHSGDDLRLTLRDDEDTILLQAGTTGGRNYMSVEANDAGDLNTIVFEVPYDTGNVLILSAKDIPEGVYYGTIVKVAGGSRERLLPLVIKQSVGPSRSA